MFLCIYLDPFEVYVSLLQALKQWGRRESKRHAKSLWGDKGKRPFLWTGYVYVNCYVVILLFSFFTASDSCAFKVLVEATVLLRGVATCNNSETMSSFFFTPECRFPRSDAWFLRGPIYLEKMRGKAQRQAGCIWARRLFWKIVRTFGKIMATPVWL